MDQEAQILGATLDWAETLMEYLIDQGLIVEALGLGLEFHGWMRAPLGFGHSLEFPVDG